MVDYSSTSSDSEKSTNGVDNKGKNYPVLEDNWKCSTGYSGEESLKSSTSSQREYIRGNKRKRKERKIEINKRNRNSGEEYVNYKNKKIEKKIVLANPCAAKKCNNKCNAFSDDGRYQIFKLFWSLKAVEEKRGFINGCVNVVPVQRKRTLKKHSRRGLTYQYFFVKDGIQLRVCSQFFIATLNISHKLVRSSIKGKVEENKDNRGRHEPRHKATTIQLDDFRRFIRALPAVRSHYCRSSSNKLYLPAEVKSIANLYRSYVNHVQEEGKIPLCLSSFRKLFHSEFNIGIHIPRKDKCQKCEKYKNISDEIKTEADKTEYLNHQKEKNDAKQLFLKDQSDSNVDGLLVGSFDLQKVLSSPHGPNMMYGFSRKYAVYNFTVYESKTQNGLCYIGGKKMANAESTKFVPTFTITYNKLTKKEDTEKYDYAVIIVPDRTKIESF